MQVDRQILEGCSGNLIPNVWYELFKRSNKPDLVAIILLGEICFKYRAGDMINGKMQVSYKYFQAKFGFTRSQIRDAFVRLEEREIITRQVVTQTRGHQTYGGVLYLHFNEKRLVHLQQSVLSARNKILTPPQEKSNTYNKNSNNKNYCLTQKDLDLVNTNLEVPISLAECTKLIDEIHCKYPKLLFPSKICLLKYLKKALESRGVHKKPQTQLIEQVSQPSEENLDGKVKRMLLNLYGPRAYASWFSRIKVESSQTGSYAVVLPNKFMRDWIEQHYRELILGCISNIDGLVSEVTFLTA